MPDFVTDGKIGVDLTKTYASASAASSIPLPFAPGTRVGGSNNSTYMFVRAESTIAAYDFCVMSVYGDSASSTPIPRAVPATTTNVAALGWGTVAIAQNAIESAYYGWVALNGSALKINSLIGCNPKVPLYTTATAGSVDDTTVSAGYIVGLVINTSATSASAPIAMANNIHVVAHA